ncbi:hypothetical protein PYW07_009688 [Mythimna separata]|uniref:EGF-like domain-containing protein n=1 Tax=Mythimna separata TaxID=271217 RepID=A0AAD7YBY8_MYTSE|nr:hypothetical protein PYW07_009688 [Mythimna separata]
MAPVLVGLGLEDPGDIAIDYLGGNIYFSDAERGIISACRADGSICTTINTDTKHPRFVTLDVRNGKMYWSDWHGHGVIMSSRMDGSHPDVLVDRLDGFASGLAIDPPNGRLYFVDKTIKVVMIEGQHVYSLFDEPYHHPYSLAVFENTVYWSNWVSNSVQTVDKLHGSAQKRNVLMTLDTPVLDGGQAARQRSEEERADDARYSSAGVQTVDKLHGSAQKRNVLMTLDTPVLDGGQAARQRSEEERADDARYSSAGVQTVDKLHGSAQKRNVLMTLDTPVLDGGQAARQRSEEERADDARYSSAGVQTVDKLHGSAQKRNVLMTLDTPVLDGGQAARQRSEEERADDARYSSAGVQTVDKLHGSAQKRNVLMTLDTPVLDGGQAARQRSEEERADDARYSSAGVQTVDKLHGSAQKRNVLMTLDTPVLDGGQAARQRSEEERADDARYSSAGVQTVDKLHGSAQKRNVLMTLDTPVLDGGQAARQRSEEERADDARYSSAGVQTVDKLHGSAQKRNVLMTLDTPVLDGGQAARQRSEEERADDARYSSAGVQTVDKLHGSAQKRNVLMTLDTPVLDGGQAARQRSEEERADDARYSSAGVQTVDKLHGSAQKRNVLMTLDTPVLDGGQAARQRSEEERADDARYSSAGVQTVDKLHGSAQKRNVLMTLDTPVLSMHMYHPVLMNASSNPCSNNNCSHLCLVNSNTTHVCACPDGMEIVNNVCHHVGNYRAKYLVVAGRELFTKIQYDALGNPECHATHFDIGRVQAMAYDQYRDSLFLYDGQRKTVNYINMTDFTLGITHVLIYNGLDNVVDMDYDYATDNLYILDAGRRLVEVMSLKTQKRAVVHRFEEQEEPISMCVLPDHGRMMVAVEESELRNIHIDSIGLDGKGRRHVVTSNLKGPHVRLRYVQHMNQVYISDESSGVIDYIHPEGTGRENYRELSTTVTSLAIADNYVFWTDRRTSRLFWSDLHLTSHKIRRIGLALFPNNTQLLIQATTALPDPKDPLMNHPCLRLPCSDVCVQEPHDTPLENPHFQMSYKCLCPPGFLLKNSQCMKLAICGVDEILCYKSNNCVPKSGRCDGKVDCVWGEDEEGCNLPSNKCKDTEFACTNSSTCLPRAQLCDGLRDCPDGADEDATECARHPCPEDDFMCTSGFCIPKTWVCDRDADCNDGSDEVGCVNMSCSPGFYECRNRACIEMSKRCDRQQDCLDYSDEDDCEQVTEEPPTCEAWEYTCEYNTSICLPQTARCNMKIDCPGGTDEHDCDVRCAPHGLFSCKQQLSCISMHKVCNGQEDCVDGSDETLDACLLHLSCMSLHKVCNAQEDCVDGSDETLDACVSGKCVELLSCCTSAAPLCTKCATHKKTVSTGRTRHSTLALVLLHLSCMSMHKVCNAQEDCVDGSDETLDACVSVNRTFHHVAIDTASKCDDGYRCGNGQCIEWKQLCDKTTDCADGSDENGHCETACTNSTCSDLCQPTPIGGRCLCKYGFQLLADQKTCGDIDECTQEVCSQGCINVPGSFLCSCHHGYALRRSDRRSCKATRGNLSVLYVSGNTVRSISADGYGAVEYTDTEEPAITDMDYNVRYEHNMSALYVSGNTVRSISADGYGAVEYTDTEEPAITDMDYNVRYEHNMSALYVSGNTVRSISADGYGAVEYTDTEEPAITDMDYNVRYEHNMSALYVSGNTVRSISADGYGAVEYTDTEEPAITDMDYNVRYEHNMSALYVSGNTVRSISADGYGAVEYTDTEEPAITDMDYNVRYEHNMSALYVSGNTVRSISADGYGAVEYTDTEEPAITDMDYNVRYEHNMSALYVSGNTVRSISADGYGAVEYTDTEEPAITDMDYNVRYEHNMSALYVSGNTVRSISADGYGAVEYTDTEEPAITDMDYNVRYEHNMSALYVSGNTVRSISADGYGAVEYTDTEEPAITDMDYNVRQNKLYVTSAEAGKLVEVNHTQNAMVVTNIGKPTRVAVDWVTGNVYFVDMTPSNSRVRVCHVARKRCAVLQKLPSDAKVGLGGHRLQVAVDWVTGNVYFVDMTPSNSRVRVCHVARKRCAVLQKLPSDAKVGLGGHRLQVAVDWVTGNVYFVDMTPSNSRVRVCHVARKRCAVLQKLPSDAKVGLGGHRLQVAVDWVTGNVYFVDMTPSNSRVRVCHVARKRCAVLQKLPSDAKVGLGGHRLQVAVDWVTGNVYFVDMTPSNSRVRVCHVARKRCAVLQKLPSDAKVGLGGHRLQVAVDWVTGNVYFVDMTPSNSRVRVCHVARKRCAVLQKLPSDAKVGLGGHRLQVAVDWVDMTPSNSRVRVCHVARKRCAVLQKLPSDAKVGLGGHRLQVAVDWVTGNVYFVDMTPSNSCVRVYHVARKRCAVLQKLPSDAKVGLGGHRLQVAVDWVTGNVYFVDMTPSNSRVRVCHVARKRCAVLQKLPSDAKVGLGGHRLQVAVDWVDMTPSNSRVRVCHVARKRCAVLQKLPSDAKVGLGGHRLQVAVDWVTGNVYFVDMTPSNSCVRVYHVARKRCAVLQKLPSDAKVGLGGHRLQVAVDWVDMTPSNSRVRVCHVARKRCAVLQKLPSDAKVGLGGHRLQVAVDWVTGNVYFVDMTPSNSCVRVYHVARKRCAVLQKLPSDAKVGLGGHRLQVAVDWVDMTPSNSRVRVCHVARKRCAVLQKLPSDAKVGLGAHSLPILHIQVAVDNSRVRVCHVARKRCAVLQKLPSDAKVGLGAHSLPILHIQVAVDNSRVRVCHVARKRCAVLQKLPSDAKVGLGGHKLPTSRSQWTG